MGHWRQGNDEEDARQRRILARCTVRYEVSACVPCLKMAFNAMGSIGAAESCSSDRRSTSSSIIVHSCRDAERPSRHEVLAQASNSILSILHSGDGPLILKQHASSTQTSGVQAVAPCRVEIWERQLKLLDCKGRRGNGR